MEYEQRLRRVRDLTNRLRVAHAAGKLPIRSSLRKAVLDLFKDLDAIEDDLRRKRDWLDGHRDDPRWEQRKRFFDEKIVARHVAVAEVLEHACRELDGRSYLTWQR